MDRKATNGKATRYVLAAGLMLALASCTNAPVVDGAAIEGQAFHELSVAGDTNTAGFMLTGIRKSGRVVVGSSEGGRASEPARGEDRDAP